MEDIKKVIDMAVAVATNDIPTEFTASEVENTLREQLKPFTDIKYLRKHAADLYEIIEEVANVVVPKKIMGQFGGFAEISKKEYGEKISFTLRTGKYRGKRFVTRAGDKGVYKTFTLDNREVVMNPRVFAGAARLEIQDFILGRISMTELMDILIESLTENLQMEIQKALVSAIDAPERPAANKYTGAGFVEKEFDKLVNTVRAYGDTVNIYCTYNFAQNLFNKPGFASAVSPTINQQDLLDVRNQGYVGVYKGANVVILEQSFTDETNTETLVEDAFAYIMPMGKEKPVKVALEGSSYVRDWEDRVGSKEVSIEQLFDVAVIAHNYWAIYEDTMLNNDDNDLSL